MKKQLIFSIIFGILLIPILTFAGDKNSEKSKADKSKACCAQPHDGKTAGTKNTKESDVKTAHSSKGEDACCKTKKKS